MTKSIQVLLSTYNGEEYIFEQLESLVNQDFKNIQILIRDDGSTDRTIALVNQFIAQTKLQNISIYTNPNIGVIKSFFNLLEHSSESSNYYAFCDQDDYWQSDKLSRAITMIEEEYDSNQPIMYCSRTQLVDKSLSFLGLWPSMPRKKLSIGNALVQNIAVGCTIVINKAARDLLILKKPNINNLIMHDWWVYLCVSTFGKVIFDSKALVKYRQHGKNTIGATLGIHQKIVKQLENFKRDKFLNRYKTQAHEFQKVFSQDLDENSRSLLKLFLQKEKSLKKRIDILVSNQIYRQSILGNLILKLLLFFDRY